MIKLFNKIRNQINSYRQNYLSKKRKYEIGINIDKDKINHLKSTIKCKKKWYGNSYGGFYINPTILNSKSIIYSFGIGKDISFDLKCIKEHKCKVFGFDPTPKSINYIKKNHPPKFFKFYNYGICKKKSGFVNFYLPNNKKAVSGSLLKTEIVNVENSILVEMKTFKDITNDLNHKHIDVLKMDIEGSEYEVLNSITNSNVTINQILVEFHDRLFDISEFYSKKITEKLKEKGYHIFAHSFSYEEISFIHKRCIFKI